MLPVANSRRAPEEDVRRRQPADDDEAPRRARGADDDEGDDEPLRPRKKRKSARGPVKLIFRIIAGVIGGVGLIVLLYWIYSPIATDHSMLCYFPPETVSITGYDFDDGFNNAKLKEVHEQLLNNYKSAGGRRFGSTAGFTELEILRYLSGQVVGNAELEKDLPPQERRGEITVLRFKIDVDQAKLVASFALQYTVEERTAHGRKYYHLLRGAEPDISFFMPNARTLVYTTTTKECEESLAKNSGRIAVDGDMRELANKVDGTFFTANTGWGEFNGQPNAMAFGLGFVDPEVREQKNYAGRTGTAMWFGSNGNDFLFASAAMYSDIRTARSVRNSIAKSFATARRQVWGSEGGKASGLTDIFDPKPKEAPGGFAPGGTGGDSESTKDVLEALSEYARTARVYNRGRLVVIEGTISHGTPEQGTFEKFWRAIQGKFSMQNRGFGGGMMPGMPGMPGGGPMMPGPGAGPPMPGGPPR
jgi:hypothetical protein